MCRSFAVLALGLALGCGDDLPAPCALAEVDGVVTLTCPDGSVTWHVPVCGNDLVEAGEACDDGSRACTATCAAVPGVACTADDAVCVCDPARFAVPDLHAATTYRTWLDLGAADPTPQPFDGAGDDPGPAFTAHGDVALDCHLASGAPRLRIAPLRRYALVPTPAAAITPTELAAIAWSTSTDLAELTPERWIGQTVLITDERGAVFGFALGFHATPCLGTADDAALLIEFTDRGLSCPPFP